MYVYLAEAEGTNKYKIGISKNPKKRIDSLQVGNGEKLVLIKEFKTKHNFVLESALHRNFSSKHVVGEWFELTEQDVKGFLEVCQKLEGNFDVLAESNWHYQEKVLKWKRS